MYDLNDSGFDAASGSTVIFNGGVAGLVNDVKMSVYKKKPDDKENAPDYKITFTDDNGGECSTSFWYITKDTQYNTKEEQVKKQGKSMKHIIHAIYGADHHINIPKPENEKQFLDQAMKYIKDGLANAGKFRVFATYGTVNAPKQYIQPRSWVPFVESMSVDVSQTRLKLAVTIDAMDRIVKDEVEVATAKADELLEGDDW